MPHGRHRWEYRLQTVAPVPYHQTLMVKKNLVSCVVESAQVRMAARAHDHQHHPLAPPVLWRYARTWVEIEGSSGNQSIALR